MTPCHSAWLSSVAEGDQLTANEQPMIFSVSRNLANSLMVQLLLFYLVICAQKGGGKGEGLPPLREGG
jgi:hypothetical protein